MPMWYDRPCNETEDGETAPGHKFMCESNAIPDPITTTDITPVTITTSASTSKYKYISMIQSTIESNNKNNKCNYFHISSE